MTRRLALPISIVAALPVIASGRPQTPAPASPLLPQSAIFSALVGGQNPAPQTLTISTNAAPGATLQITSAQPSWLTATVTNQAGQATLTVSVKIQGLAAGVSRATIDLASSDKKLITKIIAILAMVTPLPADSAYEVDFRYIGFGALADIQDCQVNRHGFDELRGIVTGREAVDADDDVEYRGVLARMTFMDLCETRGKKRPDDDERVWCTARMEGSALMNVTLTVHGESGRGAYLKAEPNGTPLKNAVTGDCDGVDMRQWETDYANGESGASPDGQQIDESAGNLPKLFNDKTRKPKLIEGTFAPTRPATPSGNPDGWTMYVLKKLK